MHLLLAMCASDHTQELIISRAIIALVGYQFSTEEAVRRFSWKTWHETDRQQTLKRNRSLVRYAARRSPERE